MFKSLCPGNAKTQCFAFIETSDRKTTTNSKIIDYFFAVHPVYSDGSDLIEKQLSSIIVGFIHLTNKTVFNPHPFVVPCWHQLQ